MIRAVAINEGDSTLKPTLTVEFLVDEARIFTEIESVYQNQHFTA